MTQTEKITKTGDFEKDVRAGYYRQEREAAYFYEDLRSFLLAQGVPAKYVQKVERAAYDRGHSGGEEEILNEAYDLIEIFQD